MYNWLFTVLADKLLCLLTAKSSATNTEFVRVVDQNALKMRTWERGNGETLACGTGACAAAIAAVLNGYCPLGENITVKVRGGDLIVKYTGDTVYLTGATAG